MERGVGARASSLAASGWGFGLEKQARQGLEQIFVRPDPAICSKGESADEEKLKFPFIGVCFGSSEVVSSRWQRV